MDVNSHFALFSCANIVTESVKTIKNLKNILINRFIRIVFHLVQEKPLWCTKWSRIAVWYRREPSGVRNMGRHRRREIKRPGGPKRKPPASAGEPLSRGEGLGERVTYMGDLSLTNREKPALAGFDAVSEGFEPPVRCRTPVFEAGSFNHSDNSPWVAKIHIFFIFVFQLSTVEGYDKD